MARALVLLIFTVFWPVRAAFACEVALVVALDVSRSVDKAEYSLMRGGIASAFVDPQVLDLIETLPGGVMVTVTQWGGSQQQRQPIGWRRLRTRSDALSFVEKLLDTHRGYWMADTAVSEALLHANTLFGPEVAACRRRVIDVSGDGISNDGGPVELVAQAIGAQGVTINGLVVAGARPDPVGWYKSHVIAGPLPFVEVARGYQDYPRAMVRKLVREMFPAMAMVD